MKNVQEIHWNLSDLHDSISVDTAIPLIDDIERQANDFSDQYKGRVSNLTASEIHLALKTYELIRSDLYQMSQFAHLNYSVDIQDTEILKFVSFIDERASKISNILLFKMQSNINVQ